MNNDETPNINAFWKKAPLTKRRKLRVYDAVVATKLIYGLGSACLSRAGKNISHSFQNRGPRHAHMPHSNIRHGTDRFVS